MIQWIKNKLIRLQNVSADKILKYPQGKRIYSDFHSIRKAYLDPDALKVIGRLQQFGYKAYIVGGCVRDLLLNRVPKDYDIVTTALPQEINKIFANSRVIGKRFRLVHIRFRGNKIIEVSTARSLPLSRLSAGKNKDDLYLEKDNHYGTFKEDAARRDFTVNALFLDVRSEAIIDYSGGFEDLQNKILRVIGNENISFPEDPVRMLRAVKFKSLLDFELQPELVKALKKYKNLIRKASTARLHEEFNKIFRTGQSYDVFRDMAYYELFEAMFPEISAKQKSKYANWPQNFEQTTLGKSLQISDRMISEHEDMNTNLYYALLCADLVSPLFSSPLPEKELMKEIIVILKKPALELGLSKKEHDRIVEIFAVQPQFAREVSERHKGWIKTFKNQDYFLEAFIFYKIHARAEKNDEAIQKALFWEIGLRKKLPQAIHKNSRRALLSEEEMQEVKRTSHNSFKGKKNDYRSRSPRPAAKAPAKRKKNPTSSPKKSADEKITEQKTQNDNSKNSANKNAKGRRKNTSKRAHPKAVPKAVKEKSQVLELKKENSAKSVQPKKNPPRRKKNNVNNVNEKNPEKNSEKGGENKAAQNNPSAE